MKPNLTMEMMGLMLAGMPMLAPNIPLSKRMLPPVGPGGAVGILFIFMLLFFFLFIVMCVIILHLYRKRRKRQLSEKEV